mmetsp:Transcript_24382/g.52569  ORF Transcript_24382/g.52569 Transcript_24382/m.52569 type:complete len:243 (+) Transcript_24382:271-999(+)|eukprot:CAMPEP_0172303494 /NCGR_PEP_ID=MMETSP1058-20130122/5021_1 /TAXON_ID=83371 /ORGANISM="Detonula confervacea, Strain CCMP 353" /LENGTH=242 /DNA_ID=CAMNT_0013014325 /DNA_START=202 /DNA_END=930 /DNA_ORIENTATION=-
MIATKLSSAIVAPSKVANILDWRKAVGSVMGLDITRERIGVAVAEHPELICEPIQLNSISLQQDQGGVTSKKNQVTKDMISELEAAVRQHRVCAFVVNWPVHEGRMGEQCGKVLQVLDSVIDQSNTVVTRKRPFTLWCNHATASLDSSPLDEWGRSTVFAKSPTYFPGMNYSSKSATRQESPANASTVAANVLDEWVKNHWEIDSKMGIATAPKKTPSDLVFSVHSVDEYNSDKACLQSALL